MSGQTAREKFAGGLRAIGCVSAVYRLWSTGCEGAWGGGGPGVCTRARGLATPVNAV